MDPVMIGIGALVVLGVIWFFVKGDSAKETDNAAISTPAPAPKAAPASERVQALKSKEAVKSAAAPVAQKLPTKTALLKLTKAKIEETAREFDIELDARMTKENMVSTFLKEARAAAKAQLK
jgi:hypothetical protein